MLIIKHDTYLPSFGLGKYQDQVCITTVLSINEEAGYCVAYRGVCPSVSTVSAARQAEISEMVRVGGNKISTNKAREMFPEIEAMGLRYCK